MINEIYASHGYIFRDQEYLDQFEQIEWYHPLHKNVDSLLTGVEHMNIETLSKVLR